MDNMSATVSALVAALQDAEARIKKLESTH
jgi:hypothetical protein